MKMRVFIYSLLLMLAVPLAVLAQDSQCENWKTFTESDLSTLCPQGTPTGPVTQDGIVYSIEGQGECDAQNGKLFVFSNSALCMDFTALPGLLYVEIDVVDFCSGVGTEIIVEYSDGTVDNIPVPGNGTVQTREIPQGVGKTIDRICVRGCETQICEVRTCCPPDDPPTPPEDNDWKKFLTFDEEPENGGQGGWIENGFPVVVNGNVNFTIKPGCVGLNGTMLIDLLSCPGIDKVEIDVMCQNGQTGCFAQARLQENGNPIGMPASSGGATMTTLKLNVPPNGNPTELVIDGQEVFICEIRLCFNLKVVSFFYPDPQAPSTCNDNWSEDGVPLVATSTTGCGFQYDEPNGKVTLGSGTSLCADLTGFTNIDFIEVDVFDQCGPDDASVTVQYSVNGVSFVDVVTLDGNGTSQVVSFEFLTGTKVEKLTINGCETEVCEIRICCTPPPDDEWKKYITLEQFDDGEQPTNCEETWTENGFPMVITEFEGACQFQFTELNGNGCLELAPGRLEVDLTSCPGIDRIEIDVVDFTANGGNIRAFAQESGAIIAGPVVTTMPGAQTLILDIPSGKNAEELIVQIGEAGGLICDIRLCINQVIVTQEELTGICEEPLVKDGVFYQVNGPCDVADNKLLLGQNAELCVDMGEKQNIAYIEIDLIDFCSGGSTKIEVEYEVNGIDFTVIYPVAGTGAESFFIKTPVGATVKKMRIFDSCGETQICEIRICCYPEKACMKLIDFDEANPDPGGACNVLWEEEDCLMYVGNFPGAGCS